MKILPKRNETAMKNLAKIKNGLGNNEILQQGRYEIAMKCPKGNNEKWAGK